MSTRNIYGSLFFLLFFSLLAKGQDTLSVPSADTVAAERSDSILMGDPGTTGTAADSAAGFGRTDPGNSPSGDTLATDTLRWDRRIAHRLISALERKEDPVPGKAVLWSAIIPGGGQVYNGQFYKVPLVYGALGGILYAIDFNRDNYEIYKTAYENRLMGEPTPDFPSGIPDLALQNLRDQYRKQLELSYIGAGLVYILNIADAFVSAHLSSFDISDDLSVDIGPTGSSGGVGFGVRVYVR